MSFTGRVREPRTCNRSTDESTNRTVPPPPGSSPSTYHGSIACLNSSSIPLRTTRPISGKTELVMGGEPGCLERDPGLHASAR